MGKNSVSEQTPGTGLLLPSREALLWAESDLAFVVEAGRLAEKAGYDSVWVGDSLLARPRGEPLTLLASLAAATTRVTLGTAVLLPLLRHPVSLAHVVATLDRVAEGRIILGIGPGAELPGTHAELAALGVPSDRRVSAMLSAIERCRRLWRGAGDGLGGLQHPRPRGGAPLQLWGGGARPRFAPRAPRHQPVALPVPALATTTKQSLNSGAPPTAVDRFNRFQIGRRFGVLVLQVVTLKYQD